MNIEKFRPVINSGVESGSTIKIVTNKENYILEAYSIVFDDDFICARYEDGEFTREYYINPEHIIAIVLITDED